MRILFALDNNDDGKIHFRDFKNSNFVKTLFQVDAESDIN